MIYVPLNAKVMLRRDLSLKSTKLSFRVIETFVFLLGGATLTLSAVVIKTSYIIS